MKDPIYNELQSRITEAVELAEAASRQLTQYTVAARRAGLLASGSIEIDFIADHRQKLRGIVDAIGAEVSLDLLPANEATLNDTSSDLSRSPKPRAPVAATPQDTEHLEAATSQHDSLSHAGMVHSVETFIANRIPGTVISMQQLVKLVSANAWLPQDDFRRLQRILVQSPLLDRINAGNTFRVNPPVTLDQVFAESPDASQVGVLNDTCTIEMNSHTTSADSTEQLEPPTREEAFLQLFENHARTWGAFSTADLRNNAVIAEFMSAGEDATLGKRIRGLRTQLLDKLASQGEPAMWIAEGEGRYALAFIVPPSVAEPLMPNRSMDTVADPSEVEVHRTDGPDALDEPNYAQLLAARFHGSAEQDQGNDETIHRPIVHDALRIIAKGEGGIMPVSDTIVAADEKWGIMEENGSRDVLQELYRRRRIGKKQIDGQVYYTTDPKDRRSSTRGTNAGSVEVKTSNTKQQREARRTQLLETGADAVIGALVQSLTHASQKSAPHTIRTFLERSGSSQTLDEDQIKIIGHALRKLGYLAGVEAGTKNKSRLAIRNQQVKDAYLADHDNVLAAIKAGSSFQDYLASRS